MRSTKPTFFRRILLVDRSLQLRYAARFGLMGTLGASLSGVALFWILRRREEVLGLNFVDAHSTLALGVILSMCLVVGLAAGLVGVTVSHRIAGPVYALSRQLSVIAEGRYPQFRSIRRGDELQELVQICQTSVDFLRAREIEESFRLREAILALTPLVERTGQGSAALETLQALYDRKKASAERHAVDAQERSQTPVGAFSHVDAI